MSLAQGYRLEIEPFPPFRLDLTVRALRPRAHNRVDRWDESIDGRVRGIGRWTAEYASLRGLGRLHVFPGDNVGAQNKLRRLFDIDGRLDYDAGKRLLARREPQAGVVYFQWLLDREHANGARPKDLVTHGAEQE
jgi:hypothetical protein